jgi:hypothetical protein
MRKNWPGAGINESSGDLWLAGPMLKPPRYSGLLILMAISVGIREAALLPLWCPSRAAKYIIT